MQFFFDQYEEDKTGTSGCGSFVVAYFQPATSIDRLHYVLKHQVKVHQKTIIFGFTLNILF